MEFEKIIKRLEEIVIQLESGELSLEDSLILYEEGIKLSKQCQDKLSKVERKVYILKSGVDPEKAEAKPKKLQQEKYIEDNFDLFDEK